MLRNKLLSQASTFHKIKYLHYYYLYMENICVLSSNMYSILKKFATKTLLYWLRWLQILSETLFHSFDE